MEINSYLDLITTDFINASEKEILDAFNKFTSGSIAYNFPQLSEEEVPIPLFRGIKWKKPILPVTTSECSFNPNPKDFGRCHIPNYPVFYACNKPDLVPPEISATEGDIIILGKWDFKITPDIRIAPLIYGLNINNENFKAFNLHIDNSIEEYYKGREGNEKAIESFKSYMKIFNSLFLCSNIKLAGTIAHNMMYKDKIFVGRNVQCLIYSPVRRYGYGNNYAIDGRLCTGEKSSIIAKRFYALQIGAFDYKNDRNSFSVWYVGKTNGSNIYWESYNDSHKKDLIEDGFGFYK